MIGIDPSGLFSLTELVVTIRDISSRFAQVAIRANQARQVADKAQTLIEIFQALSGGGVVSLIQQELSEVAKEWAIDRAGGLSTTTRLFRQHFWEDAALSLSTHAIRIATSVFEKNSKLIAKRSTDSSYRFAIFMPTPTNDTPIDSIIHSPSRRIELPRKIELLGKPIALLFGGNRQRGRLLGLGFSQSRTRNDWLFRMDYHNLHGNEDWSGTSGAYPFGYHIAAAQSTDAGTY